MDNRNIPKLIKKYNKGIASDKERAIVDLWYAVQVGNSVLDKSQQEKAGLKLSIQEGINSRISRSKKRANFVNLLKYAAVLAIIFSIGAIFLLKKQSAPSVLTGRFPTIKAGSDRATLTLASGKIIDLDDKTVFTAGSIPAVKNIKRGEIHYLPSESQVSTLENILQTPKGGKYKVILSDGSQVWLNSDSKLRYPDHFSGNSRQVILEGEGYFEVARNDDMPFTVVARGVKVKVLGTGFNIKAYSDEDAVNTTLIHGSVVVGNDLVMSKISPGTQASMLSDSKKIDLSSPNLDEVLAWKEGDFRFEGIFIKVLMKQISRWYDVRIEYRGAISKHKFYGVIPRKDDVGKILEILEETKEVHFEVKENTITVINGPKP